MLNILPPERFRLPRQEAKIRIHQCFPGETLIAVALRALSFLPIV
jgi:hypothetical protein